METDFGFGFHRKLQPPRPPNISSFPSTSSHPNSRLILGNSDTVEDFTLKNVSQNQSNYTPCFPRAFDSPIEEKFPAGAFCIGQQKSPARKRFLVFDQSGDKMTLMYTQAPRQFGAYQLPNPRTLHNLSNEPKDHVYRLKSDEGVEDNSQDDLADEMHEDTEELNALLCSDSDSDSSEDDEVTSTAHFPDTMADSHHVHASVEEIGEEVSFSGPIKRQKLYDGGYGILSTSGPGSDAESSCSNCNEQLNPLSGSKRSQKEKIRRRLSILRSVIPDGETKDAADVISDAICYLKSLKAKAVALGLNSL